MCRKNFVAHTRESPEGGEYLWCGCRRREGARGVSILIAGLV